MEAPTGETCRDLPSRNHRDLGSVSTCHESLFGKTFVSTKLRRLSTLAPPHVG